ncbi:MAG TPA: ABC-ATPase domain-containing protein [Bacillales bacterium]|nr:ABC-ATPase domain-containing protein [Bacillales bacterium]
MKNLKQLLSRIDGKGYKAYKDIRGRYRFERFHLVVDYVQGDPFASPSKIRCLIPEHETIIGRQWLETPERKETLEDHIARMVAKAIDRSGKHAGGTGKSGLIAIDRPGQEVLKRTAVLVENGKVTVCLSVGLPARGRKVLGRQAEKLFFQQIPEILRLSVFSLNRQMIQAAVKLRDQQLAVRRYMKQHDLVAFVGDGAILPRESGISDRPLPNQEAVPFETPESLRVEIPVPHRSAPVSGMAVKRGITLIVGGGYHGKSTLLEAIERGVYDHIEGDGREFVLTDAAACKIRAEDGRKVTQVDISPFIKNLPFGKDTERFTTENASGSTSQAANIVEALEAGASALLIDEDTSATNFMIRDSRMQALVAKDKEPITPFIDKVKQLHEDYEVSTILVMGGSGDYFDVADTVVMMDQYRPFDVTEKARAVAQSRRSERRQEGGERFGRITERIPLPVSLNSKKGKKEKVTARGLKRIQYGTKDIELEQVEQLVDASQTRAIGEILHDLEKRNRLGGKSVKQLLDEIEEQIERHGLASFTPFAEQHPGELARPRIFEIAAALNRMRTLQVKSQGNG